MLVATATGCGQLVPRPSFGDAPADCMFPEGTELVFPREATLAQAGLQDAGPDRNMRGDLYVTAEPIENPGFPADAPPARMFCILYAPADPGLQSIVGPVPEGWDPSVLQ